MSAIIQINYVQFDTDDFEGGLNNILILRYSFRNTNNKNGKQKKLFLHLFANIFCLLTPRILMC